MRNCRRNTKTIYYKNKTAIAEPIYDKYGNASYTDWGEQQCVVIPVAIAVDNGSYTIEPYGSDQAFDRNMVTTDLECPIDEKALLWIDTDPDGEYNYIVTGKVMSINELKYSLKKVEK